MSFLEDHAKEWMQFLLGGEEGAVEQITENRNIFQMSRKGKNMETKNKISGSRELEVETF